MADVDTNRGCTTFSSRISVMVPYRETTTDIKDIRHNTVTKHSRAYISQIAQTKHFAN